MKPDLMKRLSDLEARQYRAACIAGLAAFYAKQASADVLFYPDDPPPLPGDDDD